MNKSEHQVSARSMAESITSTSTPRVLFPTDSEAHEPEGWPVKMAARIFPRWQLADLRTLIIIP